MKDEHRRFFSNTSWMLAQRVYSMVLSLVVGAVSAKYLGPSNYGIINYAASYLSIITIMSGLGLSSVIIAEAINHKGQEETLFGTAIVMRLIASMISFIGIMVVVFVCGDEKSTQIVFAVLSIGLIIQTYEILTYWFQLKLLMKYVAIANSVAITAMSIWRIVLLARGASVEWFAGSTVVQGIVCAIFVFWAFIAVRENKLSFDRRLVFPLLKVSYNELISGVCVASYMHMDRIMLGKMIDESKVGLYTAAMTLSTMWQFIPMAIIDSSRPLIIASKKDSEEKYSVRLKRLYLFVTLISIGASVGYLLFGKFVLFILYGGEYMGAIYTLQILVWATFLSMIGVCRSIWIAAEKYYKYDKYFTIMTAGINILLNYWLIHIMGIEGAALATVISYFFEVFIAPFFFKETRPFLRMYADALRNTSSIIRDFINNRGVVTK